MNTPKSSLSGTVIVARDYDELSDVVASQVAEQLKINPASNLAIPVGKSISGCYDILANWSRQGFFDWDQTKWFALDDYLEVEESYSFQNFLRVKLYQAAQIEAKSCFNPRYQNNYDQLILDSGGIDLCILGIGRNGHIAFNEPGTPKASWTHCVWLSESTMEANKSYFVGCSKPATKAITMGIATILASRKIILVATGQGKQEILKQALSGPATQSIPASFLTEHPNLVTVTDIHY